MRAILSIFVFASLCACSGKESGPARPQGVRTELCGDPHLLSGLKLAKAVDYLSLRESTSLTADPPAQIIDESGTLCASATDRAACVALVDKFSHAGGWQTDKAFENMVATVKDDVISYQSGADLLRLLGKIDTPQEAALLARATGRKLACGVDTAVTQLSSGAYFMTTSHFGCIEDVTVTADGTVTAETGHVEQAPDVPCGGSDGSDSGPGVVVPVTDTFTGVDTSSFDSASDDTSSSDSATDDTSVKDAATD